MKLGYTVYIKYILDKFVVVDIATPAFDKVIVFGGIMFNDSMDHHFTANIIFVHGRFVVGYPDQPFTHNFKLTLRGNHSSRELPPPYPVVGAKALGSHENHININPYTTDLNIIENSVCNRP